MNLDNISIYSIVLMVFSCFTFILLVSLWKKRSVPGFFEFSGLLFCYVCYAVGYSLEIASSDMGFIKLWLIIECFGIVFLPVFWVFVALRFAEFDVEQKKILVYLFLVIPVVTFIISITNDFHHLYYKKMYIDTLIPFTRVSHEPGVWYIVNVIFTSVCFISGVYIYIRMFFKSHSIYRIQSGFMLVALFIPAIGYFFYQMGMVPDGLDINPFTLIITSPVYTLIFYKYRMFDIKPVARDIVFEKTNRGIIVVDSDKRVTDFNKMALSIFDNLGSDGLGKPLNEIFADFPNIIDFYDKQFRENIEMKSRKNNDILHYRLDKILIKNRSDKEIGKIVFIEDITGEIELINRLKILASTDDLTGMYNRRYFFDMANREVVRSVRYKREMVLFLMDIDHFKIINDTYGHVVGDIVLRQISSICCSSLRQTDICARYGGEEFIFLLPETDKDAGMDIAERLREKIAASPLIVDGVSVYLSVSIGVTCCSPDSMDKLDCFIKRSDDALYKAKETGRNKTVFL